MNHNPLRNLPAVDELVRSRWAQDLLLRYPRPRVLHWIRTSVDECRQAILTGDMGDEANLIEAIAHGVEKRVRAEQGQTVQHVINATGILLHTNLGRAPLATSVVDRLQSAAGYANVELDLASGKRSARGGRAAELLAELVGAEDALLVNNCAAATMLVLQGVAAGREVIISRGQLVEIGGGFRLPEVFEAAGVRLREVGTTNRTYLRDYERAIAEQTGAILRVHRSNFSQSGFVTEPSIAELAGVARPKHVTLIDDLGSGCLYDLAPFGLREPIVSESIRAGADLALFSGDKLLGGPQCGIIVGRHDGIERLRRHPMMRALRCDKLTLAAMEATLEIHIAGDAFEEIPVLRMIAADAGAAGERAKTVLKRLANSATKTRGQLEVVPLTAQVGGGSIPGATLPSFGVRVSGVDAERLASRLRSSDPAIQSCRRDDCVLLDMRCVLDDEAEVVARRLGELLAAWDADEP